MRCVSTIVPSDVVAPNCHDVNILSAHLCLSFSALIVVSTFGGVPTFCLLV